ncbi:divalent-cation tolerance protein CutA [Streptomyces sp. A0592]|nr:divalent-cation tolerance protein CutA [Streptomyces sp. A0592]
MCGRSRLASARGSACGGCRGPAGPRCLLTLGRFPTPVRQLRTPGRLGALSARWRASRRIIRALREMHTTCVNCLFPTVRVFRGLRRSTSGPPAPYGCDASSRYGAPPMADFLIMITTVDNQTSARRLSRSAVEASLAASGQVTGPIETTYRHLGEVSKGTEYQVTFRTTGDRREALEKHLVDNHPYD